MIVCGKVFIFFCIYEVEKMWIDSSYWEEDDINLKNELKKDLEKGAYVNIESYPFGVFNKMMVGI